MTATEERYARSVRSSHLECPLDRPADIDALIAAGLVRDGIGVDLLRLRIDYDAVSGLPGGRKSLALLKRMAPTRLRLIRFACDLADQKRFAANADEIEAIVIRVIDLYLDPTCPPCEGTGLVGEYGTVRSVCQACHGSKARELLWDGEAQERFVRLLQVRMAEKIDTARRVIQRKLRNGD